jgi:predicted nucleotidyltransferase
MRDVEDSSVNRELVLDLHESGIAAPSWTTINGETVVRCAIINHRTTHDDIDLFFDAISELAAKRCPADQEIQAGR